MLVGEGGFNPTFYCKKLNKYVPFTSTMETMVKYIFYIYTYIVIFFKSCN